MDRSICFEAITKQTGSVTLSCEHNFHFRCITEWFQKQVLDNLQQTCPCCRSGGTDLDRCASDSEPEDEEEFVYEGDDEEEDDEEYATERESFIDLAEQLENGYLCLERLPSGEWVITNKLDVAYESVRNLFGPLNEFEEEQESPQQIAARKIQAFFRGNQAQNTHKAAMTLMRLFQQAYNI